MKNYLIVPRELDGEYEAHIQKVVNYLTEHKANCKVIKSPSKDEVSLLNLVNMDVDCVLTIGGDGTVIRVAQNLSAASAPLVGMNHGHLGYLCDINPSNMEECLDKLLNDDFAVEERMMLEGGTLTQLSSGVVNKAINDVVITGSEKGHSVINLNVSVNGINLYSHSCDGLIIATPTGSTAYNLSASGPIVNPRASCILLTPINPHTLNSRGIVLAPEDTIEVELEIRGSDSETAEVYFDGISRAILKKGETLKVYKSNDTTKMIRLENSSFLERIRARMQEI